MAENAADGQRAGKDGARNLPAVPDGGQLEQEVLDGQIVDEPPQPQRPVVVVLRPVVTVVQVVVRPVPRHSSLIAAGAVVAVRRWHQRRTRHERMARSAEAAGDHASALEWARQAELERQHRHERRRAWVETGVTVAKASPWIIGGGLILMALFGIFLAIAMRSTRGLAWPWVTVAHLVLLATEIASVAWLVASIAVPLATLAALHHLGRHAGDLAPRWAVAAKPDDPDAGLVVTADTIVLALQNIPVPELKRAFKDGWRPSFTLLPVRDGRGYEAEFSLPLGVTAEMIADRRPVLARNLHREEIETWPSAGAPGHGRLWVADRGSIGKAAPEYPLLHEGEADVFEGVPGGVLARGDGALIPVVGANVVLGGLMGQGKSNAGRVIMLGCATDPLCGLDVFVFANNGDFDAYEPRLAVYRKGLDDDVIEAAVERLNDAYEDVGRREQMLADLGAKKVTRQLAQRYPELRPHVSLFSECHELFGHPEYGELAGELAVKIVKRQRKTARSALFDTQSSRKAAIPGALVELVSVNCCFAVKSWRNNDGFLGDGSFAAGIRATELRPGRDRGMALITGISDAQFELLKWYFIEVDDDTGYDAATDVIARTMQTVAAGTAVGGSVPLAITARDLLTDLGEVMRNDVDPVRLSDLPPRLRDLAKTWAPYKTLSGTQLREQLARLGVRTTNTGNVPRLDKADLLEVLDRRGELGGANCARIARTEAAGVCPNPANLPAVANFRRSAAG